MVEIKSFRSKYLDQLIELNKSLIKVWYKMEGDNRKKAKWDELTAKERFLHGGPWNDPVCIEIHLNQMKKIGEIILLIDESDNVLGELEYHPYENSLHLDWMMIHPKYQRKHLGSFLLNSLKKIGMKMNKSYITTEPEDGVTHFYTKNNYRKQIPPYYRYTTKKTDDQNNQNWNDDRIFISSKVLGEANNDPSYLNLLLETGIKYAELFEDPYPILSRQDGELLYVCRDIPSLPEKSSIFAIIGENEISSRQFLVQIDPLLRENQRYYFTEIGETDTDWNQMKTIERLIINL